MIEFELTAKSKMVLEYQEGETKSRFKSASTILELSDNLDSSVYYDRAGNPTPQALQCMLRAFAAGIACNITILDNLHAQNRAENLQTIIGLISEMVFRADDINVSGDEF